jgi:polyhydroxyalkanoate synthase
VTFAADSVVALLAIVLVLLVVALGLSVLHYRHWVRRLSVEMEYVLTERIATPDGAVIELRRLPFGETKGPPVLCVHGIGIDHRNNDAVPAASLARFLAEQGRDVWLLTLRSGMEQSTWKQRRLMRFDAMARHDLPLAVAEIRKRTSAREIDYVGFSMGGMLLYGALGDTIPEEAIRRVVILGSPGKLVSPFRLVSFFARAPRLVVPRLPLRIPSRMVAFVADSVRTPIHHLVFNPKNVDRGIAPSTLMTIRDIPAELMADFASFLADGGRVCFDGEDVLVRIRKHRMPALFFAGGADYLAPIAAVSAAFEAWGADVLPVDKRLVLLDVANAGMDYGHGDLAIGRQARQHLFEPVLAFLEGPPRADE